jgi:hypothetical protein
VLKLRHAAASDQGAAVGFLLIAAADEIEQLRQFAPREVKITDSGNIDLSPPSGGFGIKSG